MKSRFIAAFVFSSLSLVVAPAFSSGTGHSHGHAHEPLTDVSAQEQASKKIPELIANGKLDKNWGAAKPTKSYKKTFSKGDEWVVEVENPAATDPSKKTLYLFFSLDGHYIAANFDGK